MFMLLDFSRPEGEGDPGPQHEVPDHVYGPLQLFLQDVIDLLHVLISEAYFN